MINDSTITIMYINNPDGAGYMYYDKETKTVIVRKGFMSCKSLLSSLHSHDLTDTNVVLHFRIGTSGLNDKLNCHPYPVFDKNATKCSTSLAVAHNGILTAYNPPKNSKINDTQMFINSVLKNLKKNFVYDADKMMLLETIVGTNKFAFLDDKNHVTTVGKFVEHDGYLYSNNSYEYRSLLPKYSHSATKKSTNVGKSNVKKSSGGKKYTHDATPTCYDIAFGGDYDIADDYNDPYKYYGDKNFWDDEPVPHGKYPSAWDTDGSDFWPWYDGRFPS